MTDHPDHDPTYDEDLPETDSVLADLARTWRARLRPGDRDAEILRRALENGAARLHTSDPEFAAELRQRADALRPAAPPAQPTPLGQRLRALGRGVVALVSHTIDPGLTLAGSRDHVDDLVLDDHDADAFGIYSELTWVFRPDGTLVVHATLDVGAFAVPEQLHVVVETNERALLTAPFRVTDTGCTATVGLPAGSQIETISVVTGEISDG